MYSSSILCADSKESYFFLERWQTSEHQLNQMFSLSITRCYRNTTNSGELLQIRGTRNQKIKAPECSAARSRTPECGSRWTGRSAAWEPGLEGAPLSWTAATSPTPSCSQEIWSGPLDAASAAETHNVTAAFDQRIDVGFLLLSTFSFIFSVILTELQLLVLNFAGILTY